MNYLYKKLQEYFSIVHSKTEYTMFIVVLGECLHLYSE